MICDPSLQVYIGVTGRYSWKFVWFVKYAYAYQTNRNPVTNETILDGWAESTSHDTECVTGTPCPTSVKNISFVTEWLRLGKSYRCVNEVSLGARERHHPNFMISLG